MLKCVTLERTDVKKTDISTSLIGCNNNKDKKRDLLLPLFEAIKAQSTLQKEDKMNKQNTQNEQSTHRDTDLKHVRK